MGSLRLLSSGKWREWDIKRSKRLKAFLGPLLAVVLLGPTTGACAEDVITLDLSEEPEA